MLNFNLQEHLDRKKILNGIRDRRNYGYKDRATPLLAAIADIDILLEEIQRLNDELSRSYRAE